MATPQYNIVIGGDARAALEAFKAARTTGEQALQAIKKSAGEAARGLLQSQREAQQLGRELAATRNPSEALRANFERSRQAVVAFKAALDAQRQALVEHRRQTAENARALADLAAANEKAARIQAQVTQLRALGAFLPARREFQGLKGDLDGVAAAGVAAGGGLGVMNGRLIAGVGAALSIRQAIASIGDVTRTALDFEKLKTQLTFANNGDVAAAARDMEFARELAQRLGLELISTSLAWGKFSASARGTALEGERAREIFTAISEAAAVMGLSTAETEGALLAVTQMMSKGTVSAEELRGQLGERLPGAFNLAAKAMGVTTAELGKMLESGELLAADFLPRFAKELRASFADSLPQAEKSIRAQLVRIENAFTDFKLRLANSGVLDAVARQVDLLLNKLAEAAEDGSLEEFANSLGTLLGQVIDTLGTAVRLTADLAEALSNLGVAAESVATGGGVVALGRLLGLFRGGAQGAELAAAGVGLLDGRMASLVKRIPQLAIIGFTLTKVAQLVGAISEGISEDAQREAQAEKFQRQQEQIIRLNQYAAETARLSAAEFDALSDAEKRSYEERLVAAENFHRAKAALVKVPITGQVPQEAIDATREARLYGEALKALRKVQGERVTAEQAHAAAVKAVKDKELADIRTHLSSLVKAYDDANKALAKANQERKQLAQANADFYANISGKPKAKEDKPLNLIDVGAETAKARQALVAGDFEGAIKAGERAKQIITQIGEAGTHSELELKGMAREIAAIQDKAAAGKEDQAQQDVDGIQAAIQDLVQRAEFLKHIEIGFDQDKANQSADELHTLLQEKLAKNPIVIPAVVVPQEGDGKTDPRASNLLGDAPKKAAGGMIRGPGGDTSDNLLTWLSPGEYVVRAAAVRHYGPDLLARLNAMRLPRFAAGGLVPQRTFAPLPAAPAAARSGASSGGTPIVLQFGERRYAVQAEQDVARAMLRELGRESLKRGQS